MAIANIKSKADQLKQIQALLSTATNSRQRVMYEGMLSKLKSQIKEEEEAAKKLQQSEAKVKAKAARFARQSVGGVPPLKGTVEVGSPRNSDFKSEYAPCDRLSRSEDSRREASPLGHPKAAAVEPNPLVIVQSKVAVQKKPQADDNQKVKNKGNKALERAPKVIKDSDVASQSLATEKKKQKKAGSNSLESSAEVVEKLVVPESNSLSKVTEKKKDIKVDSSKFESSAEAVEKLVLKDTASHIVPELRFLAKGVLEGEISLVEKGLAIAIDGQQYPLGYTFISKQRDYRKLQEELSSGSVTSLRKRLCVYPEVKLVDNKYIYFFNLVAVAKEIEKGIFAELKPGEFYLSGLWQHVQSHPAPCLLIYRNVTDNFLGIAAKQPLGRVKNWLKPIHVPVEGLDLTKAFKFNPEAKKNEQMRRKFYTLSVIFKDAKFVAKKSSISEYSKIPKYVKASQAEEIFKNQHACGISSFKPSISASRFGYEDSHPKADAAHQSRTK